MHLATLVKDQTTQMQDLKTQMQDQTTQMQDLKTHRALQVMVKIPHKVMH